MGGMRDILHDEVDRLEEYRDLAHQIVEAGREVLRAHLLNGATPAAAMEATALEIEDQLTDLTTRAFQESAQATALRRKAANAA